MLEPVGAVPGLVQTGNVGWTQHILIGIEAGVRGTINGIAPNWSAPQRASAHSCRYVDQ